MSNISPYLQAACDRIATGWRIRYIPSQTGIDSLGVYEMYGPFGWHYRTYYPEDVRAEYLLRCKQGPQRDPALTRRLQNAIANMQPEPDTDFPDTLVAVDDEGRREFVRVRYPNFTEQSKRKELMERIGKVVKS